MADIVSREVRSRMMSGIRGKDTRPELIVRCGLHRLGFRFRIHDRRLPGKPDIVLPRYHAVILVHGCFWHGHGCVLFKWPASREEFWRKKILGNKQGDEKNIHALEKAGWRILTVWECALKGPDRSPIEEVIESAARWIRFGNQSNVIKGQHQPPARQNQ